MTFDFFSNQMARMQDRWKATYTAALTELLWQKCRNVPDSSFKTMVDYFIGTQRQAPLLPEFSEQIKFHNSKQDHSEKRVLKDKPDCDFCSDNGYYLCTNRNEPGFWAFKCHCKCGLESQNNFPHYKQTHEKDFVYYTGNPNHLKKHETITMPEVRE